MPQVTVGTAVVQPGDLGLDTYRAALILRNASTGTQIIYGGHGVGTGVTSLNAGIILKVNDAINLLRPTFTRMVAENWSFVADGASGNLIYDQSASNLSVVEYEELLSTIIKRPNNIKPVIREL